jgi:hypothetical protein
MRLSQQGRDSKDVRAVNEKQVRCGQYEIKPVLSATFQALTACEWARFETRSACGCAAVW